MPTLNLDCPPHRPSAEFLTQTFTAIMMAAPIMTSNSWQPQAPSNKQIPRISRLINWTPLKMPNPAPPLTKSSPRIKAQGVEPSPEFIGRPATAKMSSRARMNIPSPKLVARKINPGPRYGLFAGDRRREYRLKLLAESGQDRMRACGKTVGVTTLRLTPWEISGIRSETTHRSLTDDGTVTGETSPQHQALVLHPPKTPLRIAIPFAQTRDMRQQLALEVSRPSTKFGHCHIILEPKSSMGRQLSPKEAVPCTST